MTSILLSQNTSSGSGPGSVVDPVRRAVQGPSRAASHAPKRMLDEKGDQRLTQDPSSESEDPSTEKTDENGAAVLATTSASEQAIAEGTTTVAGASGAGATGISLTTIGMGALGLIGLVAASGGGGNDAKERAQVPQSSGSSSSADAFPPRVTVPTSDGTPINGQGWVPISGVLPDAEWEYSLDGGKTWHQGHGAGVPASELAEGSNSITVVQTDKSGHRGEPVVVEVVKDTKAEQPTVTPSNGAGPINGSGSVAVGGIEAGGKWDFSLDGGRTWTPGSGNSIPADVLAEGGNHVTIRQTDPAGNQSTSEINLVKDTKVEQPTLTPSNGAGPINGAGSVTVGGIEAGGKWDFSLDGGKTWTPGAGDSIPADALAEGGNHVTIRQTDSAGNQASTSIDVVKDTKVVQPTVTPSNGANPINATGTVAVSGLETDAKWDYSLDSGTTWKPGTGSSIAAGELSEGANHITIRQTDVAGNQATTSTDVVKDTQIAAPSLKVSIDTGTSPTDGLTSDAAIDVSGIETGARWEYSLNNGSTWTLGAELKISGDALAEGLNHVLVRQTDAAGNQSLTTIDITKDTTAPVAPTLVGNSGMSTIAFTGSVKVNGLEGGATWQYTLDGGKTWRDGQGSQIDGAALATGKSTIQIREYDVAGNVVQSTAYTVFRNASVPLSISLLNDTGSSSKDRVTTDGTLVVRGDPGAKFSIALDGNSADSLSDLTIGDDGTLVLSPTDGGVAAALYPTGMSGDLNYSLRASDTGAVIRFKVTLDQSTPLSATYDLDSSNLTAQAMSGDGSMHGGKGPTDYSDPSLAFLRSLSDDVSNGARSQYVDYLKAGDVLKLSGAASGGSGFYELGMSNVAGAYNAAKYADPAYGAHPVVVLVERGQLAAAHAVQGSSGADTLDATSAFDVMLGGAGGDSFHWVAGSRGADVVLDYSRAEGDVIDLHDLVENFQLANLDQFIQKHVRPDGYVNLRVDVHGTSDFANAELNILLAPRAGTDVMLQMQIGQGGAVVI